MSFLSKLFGAGRGSVSEPAVDPIDHKGFKITAQPLKEGSSFRISARIEKEGDGVLREHVLIRADVINDPTEAHEASVNKAKQMIDQMGDMLFAQ